MPQVEYDWWIFHTRHMVEGSMLLLLFILYKCARTLAVVFSGASPFCQPPCNGECVAPSLCRDDYALVIKTQESVQNFRISRVRSKQHAFAGSAVQPWPLRWFLYAMRGCPREMPCYLFDVRSRLDSVPTSQPILLQRSKIQPV